DHETRKCRAENSRHAGGGGVPTHKRAGGHGRRPAQPPRLIASVVIVESRGNPFAISGKDAIGVMQIHLPTWGQTADQEGINLLKVEDNVDLGARILKNYIINFGLWEGVKRYNGFFVEDPVSEGSAQEYVAKVQCIY